jgi:acyl carrier protein
VTAKDTRNARDGSAAPAPEFTAEVVRVIAEVLSRRPDSIQPGIELRELVEDSIDLVEMVVTLKDRFQVQVVATELEQVRSVADLVRYLDGKVKARGPAGAGRSPAAGRGKKPAR